MSVDKKFVDKMLLFDKMSLVDKMLYASRVGGLTVGQFMSISNTAIALSSSTTHNAEPLLINAQAQKSLRTALVV
jgi:hypothetical protein